MRAVLVLIEDDEVDLRFDEPWGLEFDDPSADLATKVENLAGLCGESLESFAVLEIDVEAKPNPDGTYAIYLPARRAEGRFDG